MTLTDRKGNIRGREFPTDTGIDGNAYEETTKDQRWVGLCRQIPDTDTRPTSLSFSLSLPLVASLTLSHTLSLFLSSHYLSPHLRMSIHSSVRSTRPHTRTATLTATARCTTFRDTTKFPRWESVQAPFPVETTAAADSAPRPLSLTARCLMIPGTSKSTRPIPIR